MINFLKKLDILSSKGTSNLREVEKSKGFSIAFSQFTLMLL